MNSFVHSLGRFGTGRVDIKNGELSIICKDTESITRVYRSDAAKEISTFGRGWTVSLPDCEQGRISFEDGHLTKFTDADGNSYSFFYSEGMLECIAAPDGVILYEYNADGMLTAVTYPDKTRVYISYSNIFDIQDISVKSSSGEGINAVSYMDGIGGGVEYVYEYGYNGTERVERRFTDLSEPSRILTLTK